MESFGRMTFSSNLSGIFFLFFFVRLFMYMKGICNYTRVNMILGEITFEARKGKSVDNMVDCMVFVDVLDE